MVRAVFLDRDGVIIEDAGYIGEISRVKFLPGVGRAIRRLNEMDFKVIIVTNQAGVARGYFDEATVREVNGYVRQKLASETAIIDGIYYCPHHAEGVVAAYRQQCACRKPNPGMLLSAAGDFGIALGESFIIGDKESDIEAGRRAGCRTILLAAEDPPEPTAADYIARNLDQALAWLTGLQK